MRKLFFTFPIVLAPLLASAEVPKVSVDIAPVHALVSRVMQGIGSPDLLIPANASPHSHAMRPSEAKALQDAELVFWIGETLTPWLENAISTIAEDARSVELLEVDGLTLLQFRENVEFEEGEQAHSHEHTHHDSIDPHAWLAPKNAILWLDLIARELAQADPENADKYLQNAIQGGVEIKETAANIAGDLVSVKDRPFIVFHDAYQYFEQSFGVEASASIAISDATTPGPKRVQELRMLVDKAGIVCIFIEPQFDPRLAATILEGSPAKIGILDPLGTKLELGPSLYTGLLIDMAKSMRDCLVDQES